MKKLILSIILSAIFTLGVNTAYAFTSELVSIGAPESHTITLHSDTSYAHIWGVMDTNKASGTISLIGYTSASPNYTKVLVMYNTNFYIPSSPPRDFYILITPTNNCNESMTYSQCVTNGSAVDEYAFTLNADYSIVEKNATLPVEGTVYSQLYTEDNFTYQQTAPTPSTYYPNGVTIANPPTGMTNVFTSTSTNPNILRIKRISGATCTEIKASNNGSGITIRNALSQTPAAIGTVTTNGDFCEYGLTGWTTGESMAMLSITAQNPSVVLAGSNENTGNTINSQNSADYDGGIAFQLCYNNCDANFRPFEDAGTCTDGIINQDETMIDYGGVCGAYLTNESHMNIQNPLPASNQTSPVIFTGKFANQHEYNNVILYITNYDDPENASTIKIPIPTDYNLDGTWERELSLNDGRYFVVGRLFNSETYEFGAWYPAEDSTTQTFQVGGADITSGAGNVCNPFAGEGLFNSEFNIGTCISGMVSYMITPSELVWYNITHLTLADRIPFSYLYDMGTLYDEVFNDTPKNIDIKIAFGSFGDITLLSTEKLEAVPFQGLIRTILGAIMIFGTAFWIFRRVMNIFDKREVIDKE